jgi:hypothetical protein
MVIYLIMTPFRTSNQVPISIIMWVQIISFTALRKAVVTHLAKNGHCMKIGLGMEMEAGNNNPFSKF